jgi:tRNA C32,U32 (ribose-2'-O)-methylase TrmJ
VYTLLQLQPRVSSGKGQTREEVIGEQARLIEERLPPAAQADLEGMIAQLEAMLEPRGYFEPPARAGATRRTLRSMLTKPGWNHLELRTFRGVLSSLERTPGSRLPPRARRVRAEQD